MNAGPVKPVYVLHGSDAFLRDAARREILSQVVGDADPQLCVATFDATAALADVLDELRTLPFLAPRRAVVLRDADPFVSDHRQALEKYLQAPAAAAALIVIVKSWPSNTRLYRLVAKIGLAISCSPPEGSKLAAWLRDAAARRGKKITPDAAVLLAQWVGHDLALLDAELEKLSLYVGDRQTISPDDVSKLVAAAAGPGAFELTNAITAADAKAALNALDGMLNTRGDEMKTLGLIAWHLRRVLKAQQELAAGRGERDALPRMPAAARQAFLAMLRRRPAHTLQSDLRRLLRADLAIKSGIPPHAAMQELVIGLCS